MKINKTRIFQTAFIIAVILAGATLVMQVHTNNVLKVKNEILSRNLEVAKQPSEVEIQKQELMDLENKWRAKENYLNTLDQQKITTTEEKLAIEVLIGEKRNEMLGLKK